MEVLSLVLVVVLFAGAIVFGVGVFSLFVGGVIVPSFLGIKLFERLIVTPMHRRQLERMRSGAAALELELTTEGVDAPRFIGQRGGLPVEVRGGVNTFEQDEEWFGGEGQWCWEVSVCPGGVPRGLLLQDVRDRGARLGDPVADWMLGLDRPAGGEPGSGAFAEAYRVRRSDEQGSAWLDSARRAALLELTDDDFRPRVIDGKLAIRLAGLGSGWDAESESAIDAVIDRLVQLGLRLG